MLEWWRAQLVEALPIQYVLPLFIILSGLWIGADYFHGVYKQSQAAVVLQEAADEVKHFSKISWEDVQDKPILVSTVLHTVQQEPERVLRI